MPVHITDSLSSPEDPNTTPAAALPAPEPSVFIRVGRFLRRHWLRLLIVSAAVVAPCFWHAHIEAGDVASHTYNAWLAQLIERGRAPGLWLAPQSSNILFDLSLLGLGKVVSLRAAEKIAVAGSVLLFFWSAFALVGAISRRAPWYLVPPLAMFAYGWTFQQGLMNFYLSVGLALLGLALVAGGRGPARFLGVLLLPLMWMAHPLGVVLFVAASAYLILAAEFAPWQQLCLLCVTALVPVGVNIYLSERFRVGRKGPLLLRLQFNGSDQLSLFGARYNWIAHLFLALAVVCLLADVLSRRTQRGNSRDQQDLWASYGLPLQFYALCLWSALVLPDAIALPQYNTPLSLLTDRATTVLAVFLCCLLGGLRPRFWHLAGFGGLAVAFFLFLYQDTARLDRMEQQVERYVRLLPPGQRVLATVWPWIGSRILIHHMVDRSCVEQCFSYGNYEPASAQFRVRANPGNKIALADFRFVNAAESGTYVVQPGDLPVFEIYQCKPDLTELCMRELSPGERNGSAGQHPYSF